MQRLQHGCCISFIRKSLLKNIVKNGGDIAQQRLTRYRGNRFLLLFWCFNFYKIKIKIKIKKS